LDVEEIEVIFENLVSHPMLATLRVAHLFAGISGDKGMEIVCNMLKNNRTIKTLQLHEREHMTEIVQASLGAMLSVNSTLETLDASCVSSETGVEVVLAPLTGHESHLLTSHLSNSNSPAGRLDKEGLELLLK
jgi:hypothetical protein